MYIIIGVVFVSTNLSWGKIGLICKLKEDWKAFERISSHGEGARFVSDFCSSKSNILVKNLHRCFKVREQQNLNLEGSYKVSKGSFLSYQLPESVC